MPLPTPVWPVWNSAIDLAVTETDPALHEGHRHRVVPQPVEVLDAAGKLVIPGFVNAHYHSHDVMAKGLFEELPFDVARTQAQAMLVRFVTEFYLQRFGAPPDG